MPIIIRNDEIKLDPGKNRYPRQRGRYNTAGAAAGAGGADVIISGDKNKIWQRKINSPYRG